MRWGNINGCNHYLPNLSVYKNGRWFTLTKPQSAVRRMRHNTRLSLLIINRDNAQYFPWDGPHHVLVQRWPDGSDTVPFVGHHVMTHSLVCLPYEPKHPSFPSMGLYIVKRPLLFVICGVFDSPPGHSVLAGKLW